MSCPLKNHSIKFYSREGFMKDFIIESTRNFIDYIVEKILQNVLMLIPGIIF